MNLLHLQYFYVVAKEGGFTKASKVLNIQQPAISRMVGQLEDSVGFKLFERTGRHVQLTSQGREVFARAKTIFGEVENLKGALSSFKGKPQGLLAFGAAEPIASHLVPQVLESLLKDSPELYPQIFSGPASMLFDRILSGELEFGLFFHIPHLPPRLALTPVKKLRFHLVIRKDLRKRKEVLESFIGSREIDDTGTRTFPTLEKLKKIYLEASIRISSNNLTAHRELVLRGLGVAVLPDFLVKDDLKSGRLADVLPNENLQFDLKLVQRETSVPSFNARAFLKLISK
jgi:DNA-binding transcriptional LysR family regulator